MDHSEAKKVFYEIQARPYKLSTKPNVPADNCYYKGMELLQRLGVLGYEVRGRCCETFWDPALIPADIIDLWNGNILVTHFFVEVNLDGKWTALDPSFDPPLAKAGFTVTKWGDNQLCFPNTKLYTQEENIAYLLDDEENLDEWFEKNAKFLNAFNHWIETKR